MELRLILSDCHGTLSHVTPSQPQMSAQPLPFSLDSLQCMLASCDDHVSYVLSDKVTAHPTRPNSYIVPCAQNMPRACVYCPTRIHTTSTCNLVVTRDNDKRWRVEFHCSADECNDTSLHFIGYVANKRAPAPAVAAPARDAAPQPAPAPLRVPAGIFSRPADELYDEPRLRKITSEFRVYGGRSPCGTGKTLQLMDFIKEQNKVRRLRLVVVNHRRAISKKVCEMFPHVGSQGWFHYKENSSPIDLIEHMNLSIQIESLGRVTYDAFISDKDTETIFIIDECNAVMQQLRTNSKFGDPLAAQSFFHYLCRNAAMVIALDGYLHQDTLDILEKYTEEKAYLAHNLHKSRAGQRFQFTKDVPGTMLHVLKCVQDGERVIVPCFTKEHAETVYRMAKVQFGDSKKVLLYTGDLPLDTTDVNAEWVESDVVIYSPTIDCAISFEVPGHFSLCVAFFDNKTGPSFHTAAQMISRARDVKNFIIAYTHSNFLEQSLDKNVIIQEMQPQLVQDDISFYGTARYSEIIAKRCAAETWESCTPVVATSVYREMVRRMTQQNFVQNLSDLLQQDGAQVDHNWLTFQDNQMPPIDKEAVKAVVLEGVDPTALYRAVILQYHFNGFDPEDQQTLEMYNKPAKFNAYENLNLLALNGTCFNEAMERIRLDTAKLTVGLELLRRAGNIEKNAIDSVAISGDVIGGNYVLKANKAAVALLEVITGATDPFQIPDLSSTVIAARLQCQTVTTTVRGKNGDREKNETLLSPASKKLVMDAYNAWILTHPPLHTPFRLHKSGPLSLIKAMHMLDHVLKTMYDMTYQREGERKMVKGERMSMYSASESTDFPRVNEDFSFHKTKPSINRWISSSLTDLVEAGTLRVGKRFLQLGEEYICRRGGHVNSSQFPPVQPEHVISNEKRPRI